MAIALVAVVLLAVGDGAARAQSGWSLRSSTEIADGASLQEWGHSDPVEALAVEVDPSAGMRVGAVLSGDRVDGGRETVSSMCRRVGAVACVNANFAVCSGCAHPFGGVVIDGRLVRSPTPGQDDLSVIDGRLSVDRWPWSVRVEAAGEALELDGVNLGPVADAIVVHTRDFGPTTSAAADVHEVVIIAPQGLRTGPDHRQRITFGPQSGGGATSLSADTMVLTGLGAGAERLRSFVDRHEGEAVEIVADTPSGLEHAVSGHPILLRDGVTLALDQADGKVAGRHPRTLVGWNDEGRIWIVVVDGRRSTSRGLTLASATEYLRELGATNAVNLDGGGSSALVAPCPTSTDLCVRNQPSDGRERPITVALALYGEGIARPASTVPAPVPTTVPAPVTTPTTTAPIPTAAVPTTTVAPTSTTTSTTTTIAPTTTTTSTTVPLPPRTISGPSEPVVTELAAAPAAGEGIDPRLVPALVAHTLVMVEVAALGRLRRRRSPER
ncbi:MAG: phosphodiester glycosidase family protein [Acidimicrobiales bacterium]|nr:phosphodiester glycosidase family protein [Acidimicrobiales bacterium]